MTHSLGGLLLLPVPTEGTITHVADTLPSAANLRIIVTTNMKNTVVAMDRVIKALKLLKQTHPEYADVSTGCKTNLLSLIHYHWSRINHCNRMFTIRA